MGLGVDVGLERGEAPEVVSEDASEPPGPVLIGSRGVVHTTCNQESLVLIIRLHNKHSYYFHHDS